MSRIPYRLSLLICLTIMVVASSTGCGKKESAEKVEVDKVVGDAPGAIPPREMKIGILGPETGELAEYGAKTLMAAEIAVAEINARGGVGGTKLELIHMDNKNDRDLTTQVMEEMIRAKVVAVVANPTGWSTFGPISLANEYHTILISAGTRRKTGHSGNYVFRNTSPDEIAVAEVVKYAVSKLGYKEFALVTAMDDDYSITLSGIFKKEVLENGARISAENYAMTGGVEEMEGQYADIAKDIKAKGGAQAIIYTGGIGAVKVLKEVRKVGIKAPLIGGEDLHNAAFLKEAGDPALDSLLFTGYVPTPASAKFSEAYKAKTGSEPDSMAALSYDAVMMTAKALETAKSTAPDKVREALAQLKDFQGITGTVSYEGGGEPRKKPFMVRVTRQGAALGFVAVQ